jgi:hypothetical protein
MKLRLLAVLCAVLAFAFSFSQQYYPNSGFITAHNTASLPAGPLTPGSFVAVPIASNCGSVTFSVNLNYAGQIHLYTSTGSGSTTGGSARIDQVAADAASTIVPANTNGTYTCSVGPGTCYIVATTLTAGQPYIVGWPGPVIASFSGTIGSVTANAGTNLNTSALALETGGNLATAVTKLTSILSALGGGLPSGLVASSLPTNGATTLNTFSSGGEASNSVTTSAASLTLSSGGDPSTPLFVIVTNTGSGDAWVSPVSGGHTWLCPAGSTQYLPAASSTLYGLAVSTTTTLYCIKAAH